MNTPIICPRLCSACYPSLVWVDLPAGHPWGIVPCSLAYSVRSRMTATVFQAKPHLCWSGFLTLLLPSLSWLSLNLKFWFAFPKCRCVYYIGIYLLHLFQPDFSTTHNSKKSLESHPVSFCVAIASPPLYTWFWLLGFHSWTKFWFGLSFFFFFLTCLNECLLRVSVWTCMVLLLH